MDVAMVVAAAGGGVLAGAVAQAAASRVPEREAVFAGRWWAPSTGGAAGRRYASIVGGTAALWVVAALRLGESWRLAAMMVLLAGLVALAACDMERLLLPKRIVYSTGAGSGAFLVVAAATGDQWGRLGVAAACGFVSWAAFLLLHLASPRGLGFGDVRLAALIGLVVGWAGVAAVVVSFLVASAVGVAVGLTLMATGRAGRRTALPFGVFLAIGAVVGGLGGRALLGALSSG